MNYQTVNYCQDILGCFACDEFHVVLVEVFTHLLNLLRKRLLYDI